MGGTTARLPSSYFLGPMIKTNSFFIHDRQRRCRGAVQGAVGGYPNIRQGFADSDQQCMCPSVSVRSSAVSCRSGCSSRSFRAFSQMPSTMHWCDNEHGEPLSMASITADWIAARWTFMGSLRKRLSRQPSALSSRVSKAAWYHSFGPTITTNSPFFIIDWAISGSALTVVEMISSCILVSSRPITIGRSG